MSSVGHWHIFSAALMSRRRRHSRYVMKKIRLAKQMDKFKRSAHQKMEVLSKLSSPYIVEYKDSWMDKDCCVSIVTKYNEGGNMSELIKKAKQVHFPEER